MSPSSRQPPLIVGIGASAGGLEAFTQLLSSLQNSPGFAIAFVQHLEPTGESLLIELLSKSTPMNVVAVSERVEPMAGVVYVCPPHTQLESSSGVAHLFRGGGRESSVTWATSLHAQT